jgi:glyoxalase-like protein
MGPVEIDHVLIAVTDLAIAAREIEERHGLASIEGGRHPGWGTANRIVPLGDAYLELVAVVDEAEAKQSVFGDWVGNGASIPGQPIGWAVRTTEINEVGRRLGLTVRTGSRLTPTGERLEWRAVGMEEAAAQGSLPFFIEWGQGTRFPGHALVRHQHSTPSISAILIHGDADRLAHWLDGQRLPLIVSPGKSMVAGVILSRAGREIVLGTDSR